MAVGKAPAQHIPGKRDQQLPPGREIILPCDGVDIGHPNLIDHHSLTEVKNRQKTTSGSPGTVMRSLW